MEFDNVEAIKNVVAIGLGASIVPSLTLGAKHVAAANTLVRPLNLGRNVQLHTTAMTVWGFLRASPCARLNALCASLSLDAKPLSQSLVRKAAAQNRRLFARDPPSKEHTVSNRGPSGLAKCRAGAAWGNQDVGVEADHHRPCIASRLNLHAPWSRRYRLQAVRQEQIVKFEGGRIFAGRRAVAQ
jgi:hypothetical protein